MRIARKSHFAESLAHRGRLAGGHGFSGRIRDAGIAHEQPQQSNASRLEVTGCNGRVPEQPQRGQDEGRELVECHGGILEEERPDPQGAARRGRCRRSRRRRHFDARSGARLPHNDPVNLRKAGAVALLFASSAAFAKDASSRRSVFLDFTFLGNPAPAPAGISLGYNLKDQVRLEGAYGSLSYGKDATANSTSQNYDVVGGGVRLLHNRSWGAFFAEGFGSYTLTKLPADLDTITGSTQRFQPAITLGFERTFSFGLHFGFGIELLSFHQRFETIDSAAQSIFSLTRSKYPPVVMLGYVLSPIGAMLYCFIGGFQFGWAF
jgi:hypothetical protein